VAVLAEDDIRQIVGRSQPVCDNVIVEPSFATAIDVSSLRVNSLVDNPPEKVWDDYASTIERKLRQLDSTVAELVARYPGSIVVPLIVVGGVLPWTGFVRNKLQNLIGEEPRRALNSLLVKPVRVLSVSDFRWLLLTWSSSDSTLGSIVSDWILSPMESMPLRSSLASSSRPWVPVNYESLRLLRTIGGGRGEYPMLPSPWDS
jgi:hypothetical protein